LKNYVGRSCHILLKNTVSSFANQLNSNHTFRVQSKNNKNKERQKNSPRYAETKVQKTEAQHDKFLIHTSPQKLSLRVKREGNKKSYYPGEDVQKERKREGIRETS